MPVPTIKFYLREGLLPAGERTGPNQATYGDEHVRRLRLVRALVDLGRLPVASARAVLDRVDGPDADAVETLGKVQYSLTRQREPARGGDGQEAAEQVDDLLRRQRWQVRPTNPARAVLGELIAALQRLGQHDVLGLLDDYATAAHTLARRETEVATSRATIEDQAEAVIVIDVLGDAILTALRRLAQEDVLVRQTPGG